MFKLKTSFAALGEIVAGLQCPAKGGAARGQALVQLVTVLEAKMARGASGPSTPAKTKAIRRREPPNAGRLNVFMAPIPLWTLLSFTCWLGQYFRP